jgi:exopolysaccharide biosynthesis polyprenyl glycosylphosphotransferase
MGVRTTTIYSHLSDKSHTDTRPLSTTKGFLDMIIAVIVFLFLAPLLTVIALLIRIDSPGPVLFRQTRTGFNGKQFQIYKFRTMMVQENGDVIRQATRDDPRITRIGRLLRKTSIDEIPQLLNVLRGEMSLVGPRPHALAHDRYYGERILNYHERFAVKPGITGWAQVNGQRGETPRLADMGRRIELDLWYIKNYSFLLDIKILFWTIVMELTCMTDTFNNRREAEIKDGRGACSNPALSPQHSQDPDK